MLTVKEHYTKVDDLFICTSCGISTSTFSCRNKNCPSFKILMTKVGTIKLFSDKKLVRKIDSYLIQPTDWFTDVLNNLRNSVGTAYIRIIYFDVPDVEPFAWDTSHGYAIPASDFSIITEERLVLRKMDK